MGSEMCIRDSFITDVVHTAGWVALKKTPNRGLITEGMKQFDLAVTKVNKDRGDPMIGKGNGLGYLGTQCFPIQGSRSREVRHNDCNVIQFSDHFL